MSASNRLCRGLSPSLRWLILSVFAFWLAGLTTTAFAGTIVVSNANDSGTGSLRAAIASANASPGSTITFDSGVFFSTQKITLTSGGLNLTANTTIQGPSSKVTIDGYNACQILVIASTATVFLSNLSFQSGQATGSSENGAGLSIGAGCHVTVTDCGFSFNDCVINQGGSGGGVYNAGTLALINCSFQYNTADYGGGGVYSSGPVTMTGCSFSENTATDYGGGIFVNGQTTTLTNCTITSGTAIDGGGVYANSGTVTLNGCDISDNTVIFQGDDGHGGGIYNVFSTLKLTNCTLNNNAANGSHDGDGGALYAYSGYGGPVTLSNCRLSENTASFNGGAVCLGTGASQAPNLLLQNCIVDHNSASGNIGGGGVVVEAGAATLAGCTLTGNTANYGSGGGVNGTATLTDTILWGDTALTGSEIGTSGSYNVTYCDVQGGYGGFGNLNADPQFISGTPTYNLSLQPDSPCIGAGTPGGAPVTDYNGVTRANPPSIGAYEGAPRTTSILWNNMNGAASIWNYSTATGIFAQSAYGPFAGWSAKAIADGPDGLVRVLWNNTNGQMSLWSLDNAAGSFTQHEFGPYAGWMAKGINVASNNMTHVLWTNGNSASIWNYSTITGTFTQNTYGPYAGWSAKAIADGGTDDKTRVLWVNVNGTASIWSLNNATKSFTQFSFGPYAGWTANTLSVGTDNTTHILWISGNSASIWNYSTTSGTFTQNSFGPYSGWKAVSLADGSDGKTRVLWDNADGRASLWNLDNGAGTFGQFTFGPYAGWAAVGVSAGP